MYQDGTIKFYFGNTTSSVDMANDLTFEVSIQHSVANENNYYRQYHLTLFKEVMAII
jgi:hypothetical protein